MRIAHLSDLHMRYHLAGASGIEERCSRAVAALLDAATPVVRDLAADLIVVSGDLLEYPSGEVDAEAARVAARADLVYLKRWIDQFSARSVVLPGNHDDESLVEELFGAPTTFDLGGYRVVPFHDQEGAGHVPHRLGAQRERFARALADANSPPQIHVQHYLLWPPYREGYPYAYADAEELTEAILGSGVVRLVLSGHYHEGVQPLRLGDTWFAAAPSFSELPHALWAYDLLGAELHYQPLRLATPSL